MAEEYGMSRASAAARVLGDVLTAHYKGSSSMAALIEVKVETAVSSDDAQLTSSSSSHNGLDSESNYVVAIICAILAGLIIVAGLLVLLLWRLRKRNPTLNSNMSSSITSSSGALEKSNNLQNEENLRLQHRRMKTLNVSELDASAHQTSKKKLKSDDTSEESSEESYSNVIIESSPIYKTPISVDVRNNIHLAAKAGQMIEKELSLKVAVV